MSSSGTWRDPGFWRALTLRIAPPLGLFVAVVVFKQLVVMPETFGPVVFNDESLYRQFAESLWRLRFYADTQYPPLYPALLAPAFAFGRDWYSAMLAINVVVSSAAVLPAYAIARLHLDRLASLMCAAVIGVLPYHLVYPRGLMSENLFLPLLLTAVYLILAPARKYPLWQDVLTGVLLGALYLTRHISLVLIPPLVLAWWLKPALSKQASGEEAQVEEALVQPQSAEEASAETSPATGSTHPFSRQRLLRLGVLLAAAFATYAPWLAANLLAGNSVASVLGFGIAAKTNPEQLTLGRLSLIGAAYAAYYTLLAPPALSLVLAAPFLAVKRGLTTAYGRLVVLTGGVAAAVFVAIVRHSWRAYYNYPDFEKIMGRYPVHLTALFVILAFVTALGPLKEYVREWPAEKKRLALPLTATLVALLSFWLGWQLIVSRSLVPLSARMSDRGAVDGYRLLLLGEQALMVGLGLGVLLAVATVLVRPRILRTVMAVVLAAYFLWGSADYLEALRRRQPFARMARDAAELAAFYPDGFTALIPASQVENTAQRNRLIRGVLFWGSIPVSIESTRLAVGRQPELSTVELRIESAGTAEPEGAILFYEYGGQTYIYTETVP